jgi:hypothetical protein
MDQRISTVMGSDFKDFILVLNSGQYAIAGQVLKEKIIGSVQYSLNVVRHRRHEQIAIVRHF